MFQPDRGRLFRVSGRGRGRAHLPAHPGVMVTVEEASDLSTSDVECIARNRIRITSFPWIKLHIKSYYIYIYR